MVVHNVSAVHAVHEHHHELTAAKQVIHDSGGAGTRMGKVMLEYMDESKETALEAFRRWREEEASVERACKSMPFTVCLWVVFVGSQLAHRHVEQGYTQNKAMERLLNARHPQQVNETASELEQQSSSSCGRRLVGGGSGAAGRGNIAEGRDASEGLAVESVFSIESPNSVLDWVDETALRVYWMPRNWAGDRTRISHFNRVIGGIRLVQGRVKEADCTGDDDLANWYGIPCHDSAEAYTGLISGLNQEGFRVNTVDGWSQDRYVYWLDVGLDETTALEATQLLRDEAWLGNPTSLVEAQMALYNGETTSFIYARVSYTLDRTGYLFPKLAVATLPAQVYSYMAAIVMDALLMLMVVLLFLEQCLALFRHYRAGNVWKAFRFNFILNLVVCSIGFGLAGYFGFLHAESTALVDELLAVQKPPETGLLPDPTGGDEWATRHATLDTFYDHIHVLVFYQDLADVAVFWYVLLLVVKFFEAFSAVPRLAVITKTLQMAAWDLVHFLLVFGLIFVSYATGAFFLFGQKLLEWSSPGRALNTSFRALMGDFAFQDMYTVAPVSSTIWFWSYMTLVFLVSLNMLLAIIMDTYCEVKERSQNNADLVTAVRDVITAYKLRKSGLIEKLEAELDKDADGGVVLNEARMEQCGVPHELARSFSRRLGSLAHHIELEHEDFHHGEVARVASQKDGASLGKSKSGLYTANAPASPTGPSSPKGVGKGSRRTSADAVYEMDVDQESESLAPGQPAPPPLPWAPANGQTALAVPAKRRNPRSDQQGADVDSSIPTASPSPSGNGISAAWLPVQEFETRLAKLEQGVKEVIASDRKVYIIPQSFSKRAVDIALTGDIKRRR
mmetsp:Transcript_57381/g.105987  ORF Transcript_57381/g.105987 Transcript_57381/m.105987 type:complete len:847 (-) Transcript_57381:141-2681(-)